MRNGKHHLAIQLLLSVCLSCGLSSAAWAKSVKLEPLDTEGKRTWIIELDQQPLARMEFSSTTENSHQATSRARSGKSARHVDLLSPEAVAYGRTLDTQFEKFVRQAESVAGQSAQVRARYRVLLNGGALRLTEAQAEEIRQLPGVKRVVANEIHPIQTDAGPELIGASQIWTGQAGSAPASWRRDRGCRARYRHQLGPFVFQ